MRPPAGLGNHLPTWNTASNALSSLTLMGHDFWAPRASTSALPEAMENNVGVEAAIAAGRHPVINATDRRYLRAGSKGRDMASSANVNECAFIPAMPPHHTVARHTIQAELPSCCRNRGVHHRHS